MARPWLRAAFGLALLLVAGCGGGAKEEPITLEPLGVGGDFSLRQAGDQPFELASLRGRITLLFFGYATCPDACPTTMARLARVYQQLEADGLDGFVQTVFVSVDPERDSPDELAQYLGYFKVPAIGVTGTEAEVQAVAKLYGASYEKVPVKSAAGYLINHTTYVYLIDPFGKVRHLFRHADPPERLVQVIQKLMAEGCCVPPDQVRR